MESLANSKDTGVMRESNVIKEQQALRDKKAQVGQNGGGKRRPSRKSSRRSKKRSSSRQTKRHPR